MQIIRRLLAHSTWPLPVIVMTLIVANTLMFAAALERLKSSTIALNHTLAVQRDLSMLMTSVTGAESAQRGYVLTGDPRQLAPFHQAVLELDEKAAVLSADLSGKEEDEARVDEITAIARQKLEQLASAIDAYQDGGIDAAARDIGSEQGGAPLMEQFRGMTDRLEAQSDVLLEQQESEQIVASLLVYVSAGVFIAGTVFLLFRLYGRMRSHVVERSNSARELQKYADSLDKTVSELELERNEISAVYEAGTFLQSCNSLRELESLTPRVMGGLFPGTGGEISVYSASRNQLTSLAAWNDWTASGVMTPDACWALRGGKAHFHSDSGRAPSCSHIGGRSEVDTLCVPLVAHGDTVGLLVLACRTDEVDLNSGELIRRAELVGRQLGQTIANLKLRETLNEQSTRDPLTQVLNRRYLDNVGKRELAHVARSGQTFGVAMLDVDHFKRFNDVHGHAAGDIALTSVASCLQRSVRESDWVFRYGGEEFVLLLRDCDAQIAESVCELVRKSVEELLLNQHGQALPGVTVSIGVTVADGSVDSFEDVLAEADAALYEAKRGGRNRVRMANSGSSALVALPASSGDEVG